LQIVELIKAIVPALFTLIGAIAGVWIGGKLNLAQKRFEALNMYISQKLETHGELLELVGTYFRDDPDDFYNRVRKMRYHKLHSRVMNSRVNKAVDDVESAFLQLQSDPNDREATVKFEQGLNDIVNGDPFIIDQVLAKASTLRREVANSGC
jgi:hypothetical protein